MLRRLVGWLAPSTLGICRVAIRLIARCNASNSTETDGARVDPKTVTERNDTSVLQPSPGGDGRSSHNKERVANSQPIAEVLGSAGALHGTFDPFTDQASIHHE